MVRDALPTPLELVVVENLSTTKLCFVNVIPTSSYMSWVCQDSCDCSTAIARLGEGELVALKLRNGNGLNTIGASGWMLKYPRTIILVAYIDQELLSNL